MRSENKSVRFIVLLVSVMMTSSVILFLVALSLIAFTPVLVASDEIHSDGKMAIGTVNLSCSGNSPMHKGGFCDKVFREIFSGNDSIELQLFDIKPNHTLCKVDCHINEAEIYDLRGNRLNLTITRDENSEEQRRPRNPKESDEYEFLGRSTDFLLLIFILLLLSFILSFAFFKLKRSMKHKLKHKKKKNNVS